MILTHFSDVPLSVLDDRRYEPNRYKPGGLWVSIEGDEDGWSDWCRNEQFGLDQLAHAHEVVLSPDANILFISDADGIDAFTRQYGQVDEWGFGQIDWQRVACQFQGIIIAPYIWSRRLAPHTHWYYAWDCASGCIWDISAVQSITLVVQAVA
jgi:hypothetical protein